MSPTKKAGNAKTPPTKAARRGPAVQTPSRRRSVVSGYPVPVAVPAAPERARRWRLALLLLLLAGGLARLSPVIAVKVAQHVVLSGLAPVVPQGAEPGQLGQVRSLSSWPDGGLLSLTVNGDQWRLQRFDPDLGFKAYSDQPRAKLGELISAMALPDGGAWLACADGRLWRVDAKLRVAPKPLKSGASLLRCVCRLSGGGLVLVDPGQARLWRTDDDGRPLPAATRDWQRASDVRDCAALADGGLALLETHDQRPWVHVLGPDLVERRAFKVPDLLLGDPMHIGASGNVLIFNDQSGPRGLVFTDVTGRSLGSSLGNPGLSIFHPSLVAGDPRAGIAYVHFIPGLLKFELPFGGRP